MNQRAPGFVSLVAAGLAGAAFWSLAAGPALACLSCSCGGTSASADVGMASGAGSMFAMGNKWLVQTAGAARTITGSFNDRGSWFGVPTDGSLYSVQTTVGLSYFPNPDSSIGIQLPLVVNSLDKATWGPFGSVMPTDLERSTRGAFGDVVLQGSYKVLEWQNTALLGWGGLIVPTGNAAGDPAALSGGGTFSGVAGLNGMAVFDEWEVMAAMGYQRPLGAPAAGAVFNMGDTWMYRVSGSYAVGNKWRLGLGLGGFLGNGRFGTEGAPVPTSKLSVLPSVQYSLNFTSGVRLGMSIDPNLMGSNAMTDAGIQLVYFRYLK